MNLRSSALSTPGRRRLGAILASFTLVIATVGAVSAMGPSQDDVVYACTSTVSGAIRIVTQDTRCRIGERSLSWNQDGTEGPAGPAGPQGIPGPEGPAGADGATGPAGPTGATGATGATGPQGPIGPMGPQGPAGIDGIDGTNGLDGATGPMGPEGPQGLPGIDGTNGLDGATGPMGPEGPQGLPGIDGTNGLDGATGPMGPEGPQGPAGPLPTYTVRSTSVTLAAGSSADASCLVGEVVAGGGYNTAVDGLYVRSSYPVVDGWRITSDSTGAAGDITVYAICVGAPV